MFEIVDYKKTFVGNHSYKVFFPEFLAIIKAWGTKNVNKFMRGIYSEHVFIPTERAMDLAEALYVFLRAYLFLAHASIKKNKPFFPLFPKLHAVHEVCHQMMWEGKQASYVFNPAATSCSVDEDFLGRVAALTRCVSPRLMIQRTLQRYLCHIQMAWARK